MLYLRCCWRDLCGWQRNKLATDERQHNNKFITKSRDVLHFQMTNSYFNRAVTILSWMILIELIIVVSLRAAFRRLVKINLATVQNLAPPPQDLFRPVVRGGRKLPYRTWPYPLLHLILWMAQNYCWFVAVRIEQTEFWNYEINFTEPPATPQIAAALPVTLLTPSLTAEKVPCSSLYFWSSPRHKLKGDFCGGLSCYCNKWNKMEWRKTLHW